MDKWYGNVTHKDVFAEFLHSVPALASANSSISSAVSNCAIGSSKLLSKVDKDWNKCRISNQQGKTTVRTTVIKEHLPEPKTYPRWWRINILK